MRIIFITQLILCSFIFPEYNPVHPDGFMIADNSQQEKPGIQWHDANSFKILGQGWANLKHPYDRLPASAEQLVRPEVWKLSTYSAGLAVYFSSNSGSVHIRWNLLFNNHMPHMAETGIKGVDLYAWNEGKWQYVNTGQPDGFKNEKELISGMEPETREFLLYLPLYDGIDSLSIGVDPGSEISNPVSGKFAGKPIVFYGTSITQGGCASRPGITYTSLIGRRLGRNIINLGFSGNGRMEPELAELISEINAGCYVIDCLPNLDALQVQERTVPFVNYLKNIRPEVPIILVESAIPEIAFFNDKIREQVEAKNHNLLQSYEELKNLGVKDLFYVQWQKLLEYDHDATVDGVHYTDLGFLRYANRMVPYLEGILE